MELKIYSPQDTGFIQKIDWNYDELKKEIAAAIESYANSVYTDDMIKKAKEDRAKLNKVSDALKKERTRIRKKLLEPDEQFGKEVQELTGMIQKAAANIDGQIKGYEERRPRSYSLWQMTRRRPPRSGNSMRITSMTLASIFRLNV